ncbi:MAG: ABC transporter substrate-binding protein [Anaerolineae bacterium]
MLRDGKRFVIWIVLGLAIFPLLWACRSEIVGQQSIKANGSGAIADPPDSAVVVNEKETVQVVITSTPTPLPEGGFVKRATYVDAKTLNPILADDPGSIAFVSLMFEGMVRVDPFTGEWVPNLAQSWTVSSDGKSYTFVLRDGLQWSDGEPITAQDFYYSYTALQSGKLETANAALVDNIERIRVRDDRTVVVTFAEADCANLDGLKIGWLPIHVLTDDPESYDWGQLALHEFNSAPTAFSGPFVLGTWERGRQWLQLRNERYWQGAPHLEGIITKVVSGQAEMIQQLEAGGLDVGSGFDPQYLAAVESAPQLRLYRFLSDEYEFLGLQLGRPDDPQPRLAADDALNTAHGEHPILGDQRVRQAIAYALDVQELIDEARLGEGVPLAANVLPTVSWAYNTDLSPRARDPERARSLLESAGWALDKEGRARVRDGQLLRLHLYTNAGNVVRETMAALIQAQLAEVGIEVDVSAVEWDAFLDVLYGQAFDLALVSWSNLGPYPDDERFWTAAQDVPGQGSNFVSYYSPEVEQLYEQAQALDDCDQDARAEIYRQIQAQLYEDQPYIWLDVPRKFVAIDSRVGGVNPGPWSTWYNVQEWYIREDGGGDG